MTVRSYSLLCAAWVALAAPGAQAQAPVFREERAIATDGSGPRRLPVDLPILVRARPFDRVRPAGDGFRALDGLGDLRLFDASGREVPYLQVYAPASEPAWADAAVLPIGQTEKSSGFEADLGSPRVVDAIEIGDLRGPVLKRLVLEGSGDRQRWTLLAPEGTVFDLPEERLRKTSVEFAAGRYRYLRVTWDDTNSGRVPLPALVRTRAAAPAGAPRRAVTAAVGLEARPSEPGRSRYRIRLPAARLPAVAVLLDVDGPHVFRQARILESQVLGSQAIPVELGRDTLKRVERDGVTADALRIVIARPREAEIDLVIDNGSNPPLKLRGASVEFADLPWIYFEAPGGPVLARYGDRSAAAPSYDLEAARDSIRLGDVREARWEDPRPLDAPDPGAPPPMPGTGAPIDASAFRHRRVIPKGPPGLAALALDAAALAASRGPSAGFADVRIADENGLQVPYLIERREEPMRLDLDLRPAARKTATDGPGSRSVYSVTLPHPGLPSPRLVLETSARVFQRTVQVGIERPPDRQRRDAWFEVLAYGAWQHADEQAPAPALQLPIAPADATTLLIVVDEGDNRALPITRAGLLLPTWRLRFYRPERELRLLYGNDDLSPPRYDLALLAPRVMGAEARDLSLGADETTAEGAPPFVSPRVFWVGLVVAALALAGVIARLVTRAG